MTMEDIDIGSENLLNASQSTSYSEALSARQPQGNKKFSEQDHGMWLYYAEEQNAYNHEIDQEHALKMQRNWITYRIGAMFQGKSTWHHLSKQNIQLYKLVSIEE